LRIALAAVAFSAQWELVQSTNVTDKDLAVLQRDWTELEFVRPMESALIMERRRSHDLPATPDFERPSAVDRFEFQFRRERSGEWLDDLKEAGLAARRRISFWLWRVSWSQTDELHHLTSSQILIETARKFKRTASSKMRWPNATASSRRWVELAWQQLAAARAR